VSAGYLAIGAAGALIVLVALVDLFVTIFNYDGYSFLANRLHGVLWRAMRVLSSPLPDRSRHAVLSLGSASMLPATYVLWLGLLVTGFAMIYLPGLHSGAFTRQHVGQGIGAAFYLSAGAISSLTFGDIVPTGGVERALVDLETIIGLTTFTLALGYVVTTFGVLRTLDALHAAVRRHAADPGKPSSILARHFRGGQPTELPTLLESLTDRLEEYDQGLRRYPVVYYFHTRRLARSIPRVFRNLGRLLALLRWGLPSHEPMTQDPMLAALLVEYDATLERLQRSFVGPPQLEPPEPLERPEFERAYADGSDGRVAEFKELQEAARTSAGVEAKDTEPDDGTYEQYREWLPFAYRNRVLLSRISDALGYERA
jgi:hypothetical protein